jgi:TorA maturation chaperone TorD
MAMETVLSPSEVRRPVAAEDVARADFYALLAALFHHGPDAKLLRSLAIAAPLDGDEALAAAWSRLVAASGAMDEEAAGLEYDTLFVGVGKAKVSVFAGFYAGAPAADHPRVRIIEDLAAAGLAHAPGAGAPEDHFAGLFDAMRVFVAGGAGCAPASLAEQKRFFEAHVKPGVGRFLAAVREAPESNYYRKVAELAEAFFRIEVESFNLG